MISFLEIVVPHRPIVIHELVRVIGFLTLNMILLIDHMLFELLLVNYALLEIQIRHLRFNLLVVGYSC